MLGSRFGSSYLGKLPYWCDPRGTRNHTEAVEGTAKELRAG